MSVVLRVATLEDLPQLCEVETSCFGPPRDPESMRTELARSWSTVHVAERAGRVVAYLTAWQVADEVEVIQVATHPTARREGIGRALMRRVIDLARARGDSRVLLEVRPGNTAAVALYRALGFHELMRREAYYEDGEDALVLALPLIDR
jgi:ribosomal-protein-alanine N-acetyltransferase